MSGKHVRVHTRSGSIYAFDEDTLIWRRMNNNRGHEEIRGLEGRHGGHLTEWVDPIVGEPMYLQTTFGPIRTTPVVRVEDIS